MASHRKNPPGVDELYGLEPVIEPGDGDPSSNGSVSVQTRIVQCPYCGESFETVVDLSSGSTRYIEDCQVCCRPMEIRLDVRDDATLSALETRRSD